MKFVKYGRENNSGNYSCPSSLSNYDFTDVSNTQSETNENNISYGRRKLNSE